MKEKQGHWYNSSADHNKIAMTIKGFAVAAVPLLIAIAASMGIDIAEADLVQFIDELSRIVASGMIVIGLARKVYLKIIKANL